MRLNGKRIGEYDFAVVRQGNEVVVDTEAYFKVKVGLLPVFEYDAMANGNPVSCNAHAMNALLAAGTKPGSGS